MQSKIHIIKTFISSLRLSNPLKLEASYYCNILYIIQQSWKEKIVRSSSPIPLHLKICQNLPNTNGFLSWHTGLWSSSERAVTSFNFRLLNLKYLWLNLHKIDTKKEQHMQRNTFNFILKEQCFSLFKSSFRFLNGFRLRLFPIG